MAKMKNADPSPKLGTALAVANLQAYDASVSGARCSSKLKLESDLDPENLREQMISVTDMCCQFKILR